MGAEITITSHSDEVKSGLEDAIAAALEAIGFTAETYAKRDCPVDTGRLRNSITHEVNGNDVYIGTNVEYAAFVELGTSKMPPRPYLAPAASQHGEEYKKLIKQALKGE